MLPLFRWQATVDFIVLTAALYALLRWAQQARALRVALIVVGLHAAPLVSCRFDLPITSWLLDSMEGSATESRWMPPIPGDSGSHFSGRDQVNCEC